MNKGIKIRKWVESQPISVGVEAMSDACRKTLTEKGVIRTGKKVYMPPLPYTYKENELSEDLNDGMEWLVREYGISLNQAKDLLPPRDDMMEFDTKTNTK